MRRPLIALVLVLALACLAPVASAHAVLQTGEPKPNGHAQAATTFVEIRFTEDVEREYTSANVIDIRGESVANGVVQFDPIEHNVIRLPVTPLADGIYSVSWRTLSVDSHTARGQYVFSVGNATLAFADDVAAHDHAEHGATTIAEEGFARGVAYAGLFLALGLPFFALVVDRERDVPRRLLTTAALFAALGASACVVSLLLFSKRTGIPIDGTLTTEAGSFIILRGALLAAAGLCLAVALAAPPRARRNLAILGVLVAGGALVATAMGSHAAADRDQPGLSIAADAIHLATGAVWVGGVFAFLLVGWGRTTDELSALILRFTPFAMGSVALLLLTGTYASLRHIPRVSDLWRESYGRLVALKVLLLLPLIGMGYLNKERLGPRLKAGTLHPRWFRRAIVAEALLMVSIVAAAGILAATPPPDRDVQEGSQGPPPYFEMTWPPPSDAQYDATLLKSTVPENKTHIVVHVRPNPPSVASLQRVSIQLHPLTADGLPQGTRVFLKLAAPNETEPDAFVDIEKVKPDEWSTAESGYFTEAGTWRLYVILQRPDEYKKIAFDVPVISTRSLTP